MSKKRIESLAEAADTIAMEFQRKGFLPKDAIYVLFATFMNVSLSCDAPIACLSQMHAYLSKWFDLMYDKGEIGKLEEDTCQKLLKALNIRRITMEE